MDKNNLKWTKNKNMTFKGETGHSQWQPKNLETSRWWTWWVVFSNIFFFFFIFFFSVMDLVSCFSSNIDILNSPSCVHWLQSWVSILCNKKNNVCHFFTKTIWPSSPAIKRTVEDGDVDLFCAIFYFYFCNF